MDIKQIEDLRAMLPTGRTLFTYAKHQYGLQLLRYAAPRSIPVNALRQTAVAPLLQKPQVKTALAQCGREIQREFLDTQIAHLPAPEHYVLTLGVWATASGRGRAMQTSRAGANLVLQLNFSNWHNRAFERLVKPKNGWEFNHSDHPALHDERAFRRYTLAWARLDIDFDRGETLIEEIQTDWVRGALSLRRRIEAVMQGRMRRPYHWQHKFEGKDTDIVEYCERYLAPHRERWDEAMLSATLFFLREELGMGNIWMHTPQSGIFLKQLGRYSAPPVSLYSDLPRRFCFRETETMPVFLAREKKTVQRLRRLPNARLQKFML
ncbi:MAG: hypothetical protein FWG81_09740 [Betaproteobacteria bacterium]|nr:hypothetical protein [Betaproteobacteria bacterium]